MIRLLAPVFLLMLVMPFSASAQQVKAKAADATEAAHVHYAWANVTRVDPILRMVEVAGPRRACEQQQVADKSSPGASSKAGTLAANNAPRTKGKLASVKTSAQPCQALPKTHDERRIVGYNVEYRYRGNVYLSRMGYDPGERLRVRVSVTPVD